MLRSLFRIHIMAILAVIGSLVGSLVMLLVGTYEVFEAIILFLGVGSEASLGEEITQTTATVLSALDSYLIALVLLYFAYNLYFLVTYPGEREKHLGVIKMPPGLAVESLDQMKKTMLIVIVVSLSVLLLKETMRNAHQYVWTDLFVPLSILAVALAIRLIKWGD